MKTFDQSYRRGMVQERFAAVLEVGTTLGVVILGLAFVLYLLGIPAPAVPIDRVPEYWSLSAREYGRAVNDDFLHLPRPPTGWDWVRVLPSADYLNLVGIATLGLTTLFACAVILPLFLTQRRWAYFFFGIVELFVFVLAASGILPICH